MTPLVASVNNTIDISNAQGHKVIDITNLDNNLKIGDKGIITVNVEPLVVEEAEINSTLNIDINKKESFSPSIDSNILVSGAYRLMEQNGNELDLYVNHNLSNNMSVPVTLSTPLTVPANESSSIKKINYSKDNYINVFKNVSEYPVTVQASTSTEYNQQGVAVEINIPASTQEQSFLLTAVPSVNLVHRDLKIVNGLKPFIGEDYEYNGRISLYYILLTYKQNLNEGTSYRSYTATGNIVHKVPYYIKSDNINQVILNNLSKAKTHVLAPSTSTDTNCHCHCKCECECNHDQKEETKYLLNQLLTFTIDPRFAFEQSSLVSTFKLKCDIEFKIINSCQNQVILVTKIHQSFSTQIVNKNEPVYTFLNGSLKDLNTTKLEDHDNSIQSSQSDLILPVQGNRVVTFSNCIYKLDNVLNFRSIEDNTSYIYSVNSFSNDFVIPKTDNVVLMKNIVYPLQGSFFTIYVHDISARISNTTSAEIICTNSGGVYIPVVLEDITKYLNFEVKPSYQNNLDNRLVLWDVENSAEEQVLISKDTLKMRNDTVISSINVEKYYNVKTATTMTLRANKNIEVTFTKDTTGKNYTVTKINFDMNCLRNVNKFNLVNALNTIKVTLSGINDVNQVNTFVEEVRPSTMVICNRQQTTPFIWDTTGLPFADFNTAAYKLV
jgi:hypothetical protein